MEEAGLAMQTTTGHLSSMYTTVGNYRDVTVALIFFRGVGDARASACRRLDSAHSFLCAFLSVWFYYIYIFFINTHRCKTHTRGRISTHVPVSCFFFSMYLSISMWCGYMLLVFWFCHWQKSPSRKESADQRFCRAFSHDFSLRHVPTKRSTDQLNSQFFDPGKLCRGYSSRLTEN